MRKSQPNPNPLRDWNWENQPSEDILASQPNPNPLRDWNFFGHSQSWVESRLNQTQTLSGIETKVLEVEGLDSTKVSTKPKPSQGLKRYFCPDYGSTGIWGLNQTQTLSGIETKYITPSILVPIASLNQTQTLSGIETVSCSAFWLSTDAVSTKPKPSQGLKPLPCGVGSRIWTIVSTKPKPSQGLKLNTDTV